MPACTVRIGAALAVAAASTVVAGARGGEPYHNPTSGSQIALQIPGMDHAAVQRDLVYGHRDGVPLRLDVYRPRGARRGELLPGVLLVHGSTTDPSPKDWGIYVGWGQLLAASGLAGIPFNHTGRAADVAAALAFVRKHGARLGIDRSRLCLASFSFGVPLGMGVALRDGQLRCALAFYGPPDAHLLRRSAPPTLIAEAGLDDPGINTAIDRYVARARAVGARVRLIVHSRGGHGFDALNHDARTRAILRAAIHFAEDHLGPQ